MAKEQYGVKLDPELIDELEKIKFDNGLRNRDDLLALLVNQYNKQKELSFDEQLDLSQYDEIEDDAKKAIKDGFELIVSTIKQYNKKTKFLASQIEQDKELLDEERGSLQDQLKDIKLQHNEEIKKINDEQKDILKLKDEELISLKTEMNEINKEKDELNKNLISMNEEMTNLRSIAENTKAVIDQNKQLNLEIERAKETHAIKVEELSKASKQEIDKLKEELKESQNNYLKILTEKSEISSSDNFNKKELLRLNDVISELKEKQKSDQELLLKQHQVEVEKLKKDILSLKEYEKENIKLQTKLELANEEIKKKKAE